MILNSPTISGSLTVTGNIIASGSITLSGSVASASFATSASNATNAISASYANNLTVAGTLTAQTLVVQTITSSVDFVTGSTRFGSLSSDTMKVTGSILVTGSLNIINSGSLFVSTSGFIGMNTTQSGLSTLTVAPLKTPGIAFQVIADGSGRATSFYTSDYVSLTTGSTLRMGFLTGSGNTSASIQAWNAGETTYGSLLLNNGGGNVGIGTTTPDYPLTIQTNTAATSLKILGRSSGDTKVSWYSSDNATQYAHIDIGAAYFQIYASNNQPIQFYTSGSGGLSLTLNADKSATFSSTITSQANGSIFGTTSTTGATLTLQAGTSNRPLIVKNSAGGDGSLFVSGTSTSLNYSFGTYSTSDALTISNAGDVGLGTATPSAKIHAVGINTTGANNVIYLENSVATVLFKIRNDGVFFTGVGAGSPYNNTYANAANIYIGSDGVMGRSTASSQRFKENINEWNGNGLETILSLKPKTFTYKADYYKHPDVVMLGLIAEEVAEVSPYLVDFENEDRTGQVENVRYATIVVPLIKAIQELKSQNDALQSRIETLESK